MLQQTNIVTLKAKEKKSFFIICSDIWVSIRCLTRSLCGSGKEKIHRLDMSQEGTAMWNPRALWPVSLTNQSLQKNPTVCFSQNLIPRIKFCWMNSSWIFILYQKLWISLIGRTGLKWLQNKAHLSLLKIFPKYYSGLPKQNKTKQNSLSFLF